MNSLKDMVRDRKVAEGSLENRSPENGASQLSLHVHVWNGKKWVLPWGYFYGASLEEAPDRDQLVLRIAHHEIVVDGSRLALLLPRIGTHQLDLLRNLPPKFQVETDKTTPFVTQISVRLAEESPMRSNVKSDESVADA